MNPESDDYMRRVYRYIRDNGGWDQFEFSPIETVEFEDVLELRLHERYWIEKLKSSLNCNIPTRTDAEWREDNKEHRKAQKHEYAIANSAAIVEKVRQWRLQDPALTKIRRAAEYQKSKERTLAQQKEDRLNNPEKHKARSLKYRTEHAEELRAKHALVVVCECGVNSTYGTLTRHRRTAKHLALISEAQTIAAAV